MSIIPEVTFYTEYYMASNLMHGDIKVKTIKGQKIQTPQANFHMYDLSPISEYCHNNNIVNLYNTKMVHIVDCMKKMITGQGVNPMLDIHAVRDMSLLGVTMKKRKTPLSVTSLKVRANGQNSRPDIYKTQVLDISVNKIQNNRFESYEYVKGLSKINKPTLNDLMNLSVSGTQELLKIIVESSLVKKLVAKGVELYVDNGVMIVKNQGKQMSFSDMVACDEEVQVILMTIYLLLYDNLKHRTIFLDHTELGGLQSEFRYLFATICEKCKGVGDITLIAYTH